MTLNQKTYDTMKWVVQVLIPAFIAFYSGLAAFAPVPAPVAVCGVSGLVAVFLGSLLGISSAQFKKANDPNAGSLTVTGHDPDTGIPDLALRINPESVPDLAGKDSVTLKVNDASR